MNENPKPSSRQRKVWRGRTVRMAWQLRKHNLTPCGIERGHGPKPPPKTLSGDSRRGRLRGLQGGRAAVARAVGQLGGRGQRRVGELLNVRMGGRRLGGLLLAEGLLEGASQLKGGQKLPFPSVGTGGTASGR